MHRQRGKSEISSKLGEDGLSGLLPRSAKVVPLLDQPPLGHLQAVILKTMAELGDRASGQDVLIALSKATGVWVEHAQVYGTIKKLRESGLVREVETVKRTDKRGPPVKLLEVTPDGFKALEATEAHFGSVALFLQSGHVDNGDDGFAAVGEWSGAELLAEPVLEQQLAAFADQTVWAFVEKARGHLARNSADRDADVLKRLLEGMARVAQVLEGKDSNPVKQPTNDPGMMAMIGSIRKMDGPPQVRQDTGGEAGEANTSDQDSSTDTSKRSAG